MPKLTKQQHGIIYGGQKNQIKQLKEQLARALLERHDYQVSANNRLEIIEGLTLEKKHLTTELAKALEQLDDLEEITNKRSDLIAELRKDHAEIKASLEKAQLAVRDSRRVVEMTKAQNEQLKEELRELTEACGSPDIQILAQVAVTKRQAPAPAPTLMEQEIDRFFEAKRQKK